MTKLEIISDPICPWCYIGITRLEKALVQAPDHPFDISWKPFQLNPNMPENGMDRREYLERKFGGQKGALEVYGQIAKVAGEEGIDIDFAAIKRTPNTINAHRLIHWAGIEGVQTPLVHALFKAYFRKGADISDPETLARIADSAGMEADVVRRLLATDAEISETRAQDEKAREMGVSGVPTFVIDGQYVVTGARETPFWLDLITEITEIRRKTDG